MKTIFKTLLIVVAVFAIGGCSTHNHKHDHFTKFYDVTVTNITHGMIFTPILVASHDHHFKMFELGKPASFAMEELAEGGNTRILSDDLMATGKVLTTATKVVALKPGESVTITIKTNGYHSNISLASMLLPTNDVFFAINSVHVDTIGKMVLFADAYDAGTEINTELCRDIPGGASCKGEGASAVKKGEGHVHVSYGQVGIGSLRESHYSWNNPVAKVVIQRNFAVHKKP